MKVFDTQNRLGTDACAIDARNYQNSSINDYQLWNTYMMDCNDGEEKRLRQFMIDNPNLHYRDGYGYTTSCYVDNDSEVRNNAKITNEKAKCQLFTRFYQANPDLSKGRVVPNLESRLKYADDTTQIRQCQRLTETNFNRFTPLVPCLAQTVQDPKHIVLPFNQGGESSRLIMRDSKTLQKCGWENKDGKVWLKKDLQVPK
jgi:hypothetical protein